MSLRTAVALLALLASAYALADCSRHASRSPSPVASVAGANLVRGKAVYELQCAACHGERGVHGPVGPPLRNEALHKRYRQVYAIVADPAPPMPKLYPSRMSESDVRDVSAYVESL